MSLGDEIEQGPGGKLALTTVWLTDGAELEGVGSWRVIEADDREVIGDAQTEPPGGLRRPSASRSDMQRRPVGRGVRARSAAAMAAPSLTALVAPAATATVDQSVPARTTASRYRPADGG